MKKISTIALLLCAVSAALWAVPADPTPRVITLEDGSEITARMVGDEYHSYYISMDGKALRRVAAGVYRFDENVVSEDATARAAARKAAKFGGSFPTKGSPRSLVLLAGFKDLPFESSLQDFDDLLNKSGYDYNGAIGSCRDYFIASSDSIFSPIFDVYGPFVLPNDMAFYGEPGPKDSHDKNAALMIVHACQAAHDAGVDFSQYDTDGDGILDNVFVYYAGHNQAEGASENTVWPHQGSISVYDVVLDGVRCASYACTSEFRGTKGNTLCGVGTFCHEFGHVLTLPDFYDTTYKYYSVGNWDIMCSGNYNNNGRTPPLYSAYERFYLGWLTPTQLEEPGTYALSSGGSKKQAYLIAAEKHNLAGKNPTPSEFFMLDYRDGTGWDEYLPNHGMIVWHIDYSSSAWAINEPNNGPSLMRMHLEEANGQGWQKRVRGEDGRPSDVYPGTNNVTSFTPVLHNGTNLHKPLFNITEAGNSVLFTYISTGDAILEPSTTTVEITTTVSDEKKIVDWNPESFVLRGAHLLPNDTIELNVTGNFRLSSAATYPARGSRDWASHCIAVVAEDSTLNQTIWVCYNPTKQSCETTSGVVTIDASNATTALSVLGYSPRPTYVKTPKAAVSNITPFSFTSSWKAVNDAVYYYHTLYKVEPGEGVFTQDFEKFNDASAVQLSGWQTNTLLTTTSAKADGKQALYLKNTGDQVTTETYPAALTQVQWWYNSFSSPKDTVGSILLEAYNGKKWTAIDTVYALSTTKKATYTYNLDESKNYNMLRITYKDYEASGVALDAFTATTCEKISYIYRGKEKSVLAFDDEPDYSLTFTDLEPSSTYYYQIQCTDDDKGCIEHLTELSKPIAVNTLAGVVDDKHLVIGVDSISYDVPTHCVYLQNPQVGDRLFIYNANGHLIHSIVVTSEQSAYPLPLSGFVKGNVYLIEHAPAGKIGRKQRWAKIVY